MRCTRCDRPAVPQAVALTPEGLVVFGWCVTCLEATGCAQVVVARPSRRRPLRLVLERRPPRPSRPRRARPPAHPLDQRQRSLTLIALGLAGWGLLLLAVGLSVWASRARRPASPFGNGTPALLIGGGASTLVAGLALLALASGLGLLRSRLVLRVVQAVCLLTVLATLLSGVVFHSPRRDPLLVVIASLALAVSVTARLLEVRQSGPLVPWGREPL
jgi:hypothetical protein